MISHSTMATFPDIPSHPDTPKLTISNPSGDSFPITEAELEALLSIIEKQENVTYSEVELVYVNEDHIKEVNFEYLDRDYVTDIISFRYDEDAGNQSIEGTLFCCAPRIREQSEEAGASVKSEFCRIFIHGLLHLAGYDDQSESDKDAMTQRENHYLNQAGIE